MRRFTLLIALGCLLVTSASAAPTKVPPVTLGPKALAGDGSPPTVFEYFLQTGSSWKGDIAGFANGVTYSVRILGIDATGVTGPADRFIYFNLQDAETGSSFKHLGINAHLDAPGAGGGTLLQCYQSFTSEGLSSHGLNPGALDLSNFGLRFDFTRASSGSPWTVTPYFRSGAGPWTLFFGGSFTGSVAFNFLGAKLAVVFDGGADGTLSFQNLYVQGPPTDAWVDDDWAALAEGAAVLVGADYHTIGVDAFAAIQSAVNAVQGSIVNVAAGTYHERLLLNKSVDLRGAQYGVDPTPAGARVNPAAESVVDVVGLPVPNPDVLIEIPNGTTNVLVSGFTLVGGQSLPHNADQSAIRCWDDRITIQDNIIDGYFALIYKGNDYLDVLRNRITANKAGVVVQPNPATNVNVSGNAITRGPSPGGDETGIYFTGATPAVVDGNTVTGFLAGRAFQASNLSQLVLSRNSFTGNRDAISIFGNSTFITITENTLSGNTRYGINIKGADLEITHNFIDSNGNAGVFIDRHVINTERVEVSDNHVTGNTNFGIMSTAAVTATVDASGNWLGSNVPATVASQVSGIVDYTPWLDAGTDTEPLTTGFQGDFSTLWVDDNSPQAGATGRVQEGVDRVLAAGTVNVAAGTYGEAVVVDKQCTLLGAQAGVDACTRAGDESVIDGLADPAGTIRVTASNVTIDGLKIVNSTYGIYASAPLADLVVTHTIVDGATSDGMIFYQASTGVAKWNKVSNCGLTGISGGDESGNPSALDVAFNCLDNCRLGISGHLQGSNIEQNTVTNYAGAGSPAAGIGGQFVSTHIWKNVVSGYPTGAGIGMSEYPGRPVGSDVLIELNTISGNGAGLYFDAAQTLVGVEAHLNDIVKNLQYGALNLSASTLDATCNWWNDISGPYAPPLNPGGTGDVVQGPVTFHPWLDGSIAGSPACNQFLPTTTTLASDLNPSNCGDKVNLTATVAPSSATGTVEFFDGAASLGTAPLVSGVATLSVTTLPAGHRALTAQYGGDPDFTGSVSGTLVQNVHCASAGETAVVVSVCDSVDWYATNLRPGGVVSLSTTYPRSGSGSLEFQTADATSKADWERINGNFDLLSTLTALAVDLYRSSSSTSAPHLAPAVRLYVDNGQALNNISLLIWEPVYNGYPVFPADAWGTYDLLKGNFWQRAFKTTGGVTIEIFDRTLADWLTPGTVTDGGGKVSNEVGPAARVLAYNIGVGSGWSGTFAGAADNFRIGFAQADSVFNFESRLPTTTTLASDADPLKHGRKLTLTATVDPAAATGTVEFFDGAVSLGTEPLSGGQASLSVTGLENGTHPLVAVYGGDGCYLESTSDTLHQGVTDQNAPVVTVHAPNGGEVLLTGTPTKIAWTAVDDKSVDSVSICLSRDNGATFEEIATGLANDGTYTWMVTPPAGNTGPDPVFSALIKVKAYDGAGNQGEDDSDAPFAIFDLATPSLLSLFEAAPVEEGVEVRWRLGTAGMFERVALERSAAASGPWSEVAGERREEGEVTVVVDRTAEAGRTYYYRLQAKLAGSTTLTFGPFTGTAGVGVKEFELSAIAPNPSRGLTRIDYALPREATVRLSVYDVQGREVAVLAAGLQRPGRHQATWNGEGPQGAAPAGIYFVRFQTPGRSLVERLALSR